MKKFLNCIKPKVFCILGPTCVGKSNIAMMLSDLISCDIISVDSALIYKNMDIGTDKPSLNNLKKYSYKFINILDPKEIYSVYNFLLDLENEIFDTFFIKKKIPLLVGGTMMYFNAIFNGLSFLPSSNIIIRKYIDILFNIYGNKYMYNFLLNIDFSYAKKIHFNDKYRLMRALEIFFITKKNISYFRKKSLFKLNYDFYRFIILPDNIFLLKKKIINRLIKMINDGFEDEVFYLYKRKDLNINMPSMKCIGYKQMWRYFEKKISYLDMINDILKNTFYLVKKQITWIKKWKYSYIIFNDDYNNCVNKIYNFINFINY